MQQLYILYTCKSSKLGHDPKVKGKVLRTFKKNYTVIVRITSSMTVYSLHQTKTF